jgi:hypothetical protein
MGKIFSILAQLLTVSGIRDTQCGAKLFKKEPAMVQNRLFGDLVLMWRYSL